MLDSISLLRIIKTGFVNFWRNLWLSAAATMVMVITLVIFSILFITFALTTNSIKSIQDTVDISVYFKNGVAEQQIKTIQEDLRQDPRVKSVAYKSPEEVRESFRQKHMAEDDIQQALNEVQDNPFPATLNVSAVNLEDYPAITEKLNSDTYKPYIEKVNFEDNQKAINRLNSILKFIVTFGLGLIIIFAIIAILVIFNTITLTIYNRREEVEIMRLVGATNWYIRGPFITESALYAIFATIILGAIFYPVFYKVLPSLSLFVSPQVVVFNQNVFTFWFLMATALVISFLLAILSTLGAIWKYLKI